MRLFWFGKMKYTQTSQRRFDAVETSPGGATKALLAQNQIQNLTKAEVFAESHQNSLYFD